MNWQLRVAMASEKPLQCLTSMLHMGTVGGGFLGKPMFAVTPRGVSSLRN